MTGHRNCAYKRTSGKCYMYETVSLKKRFSRRKLFKPKKLFRGKEVLNYSGEHNPDIGKGIVSLWKRFVLNS